MYTDRLVIYLAQTQSCTDQNMILCFTKLVLCGMLLSTSLYCTWPIYKAANSCHCPMESCLLTIGLPVPGSSFHVGTSSVCSSSISVQSCLQHVHMEHSLMLTHVYHVDFIVHWRDDLVCRIKSMPLSLKPIGGCRQQHMVSHLEGLLSSVAVIPPFLPILCSAQVVLYHL